MTLVWLNGQLVPRAQAAVSIDDLGFLYGAACFETMRSWDSRVFRWDAHAARLAGGLVAMGVPGPPEAALRTAVCDALEANGLRDARIRLTVSAGRGSGRPDLEGAPRPTVLVVAEPPPPDPAPVRLIVASVPLPADRPLPGAKTAQYLASLLALQEARRAGADEALLCDREGRPVEAATANLFAVLEGRLVTPPLVQGPLPGVTRAAVLECAEALAIPHAEAPLTLGDLLAASELCLTNSVFGVRTVASMTAGGMSRRYGAHEVAERLSVAYAALVRTELSTANRLRPSTLICS